MANSTSSYLSAAVSSDLALNSHLDNGCKGFKAVFLDFSNAFNTPLRQGLLDKFAATNPPYWLVEWVHNYFTGRSQYIRAHNKVSSTIPNNCGVLQGAVLSPFFFTLHTSAPQTGLRGRTHRNAQELSTFMNMVKYTAAVYRLLL